MKKVIKHKCVLLSVLCLLTVLSALSFHIKNQHAIAGWNANNPVLEYNRWAQSSKGWYAEIVDRLKQEKIEDSVTNAVADFTAIAEYRVVYNDYEYYALQVFSAGSAKFTYIQFNSNFFNTGKIKWNVVRWLSIEETEKLTSAIEEADFWNIPTLHPEATQGFDGSTLFAEGYRDGDTHFITMWEAKESCGIAKIHKAFSEFTDTIIIRK